MGNCLINHRRKGKQYAYYQLDYIQSSGTQYIDTTYTKPSSNNGPLINMSFQFTDTSTSTQALFGCYHSSTYQYRMYIGATTANKWYLRWRNSEYTSSTTWATNTTYSLQAKLTRDDKYISIGGTKVVNNTDYESNYPSLSMYLFADNNNGTAEQFSKIRLYSASLYDTTTSSLLYTWVPAIRASDNKTGLWATNTSTFFPNKATTEFSYGSQTGGLGDPI